MRLQLLFVVESDKRCKSDWIYIKDTIMYFYEIDQANIKLSPIYMNGKGNYQTPKIEKEIQKNIDQYSGKNKTESQTVVIYCFDCDDFDKKNEDADFLKQAETYCKKNRYQFVWFCRDIEHVYLGKQIQDTKKKKESEQFKAKKMIRNVESGKLLQRSIALEKSNLMTVLDQFLERKREK